MATLVRVGEGYISYGIYPAPQLSLRIILGHYHSDMLTHHFWMFHAKNNLAMHPKSQNGF